VLEVVLVMAIFGLLVGPLAGAIAFSLRQAPKESGKLLLENEHQLSRYWITRDANSAEKFTPLTSPQYGSLTWRDFRGATTDTYVVTYSYDSAEKALRRKEEKNGVVQSNLLVARNILQASAATFTWSPGTRKLTVSILPTIQEAHAIGDISRTGTLVTFLRYEAEAATSPPSDVAVPPPPPGSETYSVAANPTVITGTLVSGNAASLQNADTDFYVVDSASAGPATRVVSWEAVSQTMTAPATINQIEVRFTGKSDKKDVTMELFVKGISGYDAVADSGFTFTEADTEKTHILFLDPAKVSFVNSTRVVELKVKGTLGATWRLSTNQVLFIASP